MRAISSELPPNSMAVTISDIRFPASKPMICAPNIVSVFLSANIFTNPSDLDVVKALPFALKGNLPVR